MKKGMNRGKKGRVETRKHGKDGMREKEGERNERKN